MQKHREHGGTRCIFIRGFFSSDINLNWSGFYYLPQRVSLDPGSISVGPYATVGLTIAGLVDGGGINSEGRLNALVTGTVIGEDDGIETNGTRNKIVIGKNGLVRGADDAVDFNFDGGFGKNVLINRGQLEGGSGLAVVDGFEDFGDQRLAFYNFGEITGDVELRDGDDVFFTSVATDATIFAGAGDDRLFGSDGADEFHTGDGSDFVRAKGGNDVIDAQVTGDDTGLKRIFAGEGDDVVDVRTGHTVIDFGPGDDDFGFLLLEGEHDITLGSGADALRIGEPEGTLDVVVQDFEVGDGVDISDYRFRNPEQYFEQVGSDVVFDPNADATVTFRDTTVDGGRGCSDLLTSPCRTRSRPVARAFRGQRGRDAAKCCRWGDRRFLIVL